MTRISTTLAAYTNPTPDAHPARRRNWPFRERYFWCALMLVLFAGARSTAGNWTGDFWSHAAAVREISERALHPHHPELITDAPGSFLTPYAVIVGWAARLCRVDAVTALATAGMVNLLLLLVSLRLYVQQLLARPDLAAFYALIMVLFLWGASPWMWSAFFHFAVLPYVVPYPSTFALALVLGLLALHVKWLRGEWSWFIPLLLSAAPIVLLSHPVTAITLGAGLVAQTIGVRSPRRWTTRVCLLVTGGLMTAALAALWPYYPFFEHVDGQALYHAENSDMYVDVWPRVWPIVLLAAPCVLVRLRRDRRDPMALTLLGLVSLYALGSLTERYALGRLISHAAMVAQLCVAAAAAGLETAIRARTRGLRPYLSAILLIAVLSIALAVNGRDLRIALVDRSDWTSMYTFLPRYVDRDAVVLSDLVSSYPVPAFAGKVVSHAGLQLLVSDGQERRDDVERFFSANVSRDERLQLIGKHGVRWLLLSRDHAESAAIEESLHSSGTAVHSDAHWVLIDLTMISRP